MLETKQSFLTFLDRGNNFLNILSDDFSKKAIPYLKSKYISNGPLLSRICASFVMRLKPYEENLWEDPFSTETLLYCGKKIEDLSLWMAKRKPTQNPYLHFIDQSCISIGQHLYDWVKEANQIAQLPISLKVFMKNVSFDNYMKQATQSKGRLVIFLNSVRLKIKGVALALVDYAIRILDLFFQYITANPQFEVFKYLRDIIRNARENVKQGFSDVAIKVIEKRETEIRKTVVCNSANSTLDFIVPIIDRAVLKTGLGLFAYSYLERAVECLLPGHTFALRTITGATTAYLLWQNVYQPYFDEYYQAHKEEFNPEQNNMKPFLSRHLSHYLSRFQLGLLFFSVDKMRVFLKGVK